MLDDKIKERIRRCAHDIDKLLTSEQINNFASTLNDIWDLFKKELHWYTIEAPRIAREKNFSLDPSHIVLPEGYEEGKLTEMGRFLVLKIGKDGQEDKEVGTFMASSMTPKGILRAICEFEERNKE